MNKKSKLFLGLAVALGGLVSASNVAALTVGTSVGTPYVVDSIVTANATGLSMDGLSVTANFLGGGSQTVAWTDNGAPFSLPGVTGSGWSLTHGPGTTYGSTWTLGIGSGTTLASLILSGASGDTVFDVNLFPDGTPLQPGGGLPEGTPGTEEGWTFGTGYGGFLDAVYSNIVSLGAAVAVGDIWETLTLDFGPNGIAGGRFGNLMFFQADTDNVSGIAAVPVPAAFPLLGSGLFAMGWLARKRKKLAA